MRNAPVRAAEIGATAIQLFTKQPNRWAERVLAEDDISAYREGAEKEGIRFACAHDSYLINLASPDPALAERSAASFRGELRRANELGLDAVVTHPGNATDGDADRGIAQNAALVAEALEAEGGDVRVLFETTAGTGTALGASFEELARILETIPGELQHRVGVCLDTCHLFAAGYDLVEDYDGVMEALERVVGIDRVGAIHLNDSKHACGARRDRHEHIGQGTLGDGPFARIMNDPRLSVVPKVLETPKEKDAVRLDRMNLDRLRSLVRHDS
jgi:deoxyribonuclease IV